MKFKLCILAAGRGTRNQSIEGLHKCLLPVANKPVISHILDRFSKDTSIVIALGWKSDQIKSYLDKVHSDRDITYVQVDNYDKPGSGPGYSLLACKSHLQCPFIFTASDTIIDEDKFENSVSQNWVGGSKVSEDESFRYCLMKTDDKNRFKGFYYGSGGAYCFTGIAGVLNYKRFWESLSNSHKINGEHQVINGFDGLKDIVIRDHKFYDTGNEMSYRETKKVLPNNLAVEKDNEAIFIDNKYVIKYFSEVNKCSNRIKRYEQIINCTPKVCKINDNMFCYNYVPGRNLSKVQDDKILKYFFKDYQKQFRNKILEFDNNIFRENCIKMYKEKTQQRIKSFVNSPVDRIKYVNGIKVGTIAEMISKINWEDIFEKAIPSRFHGDMQPENIIVDGQKFTYIDWRESFGNSISVGDAYYDLGKCYHALLISNELILSGNYDLKITEKSAELSFCLKNNLNKLMNHLEAFCLEEGYDYSHVKLIGVINYLNIASLYKNFDGGKYGNFLFLLGKMMLSELFCDNELD
tara:strand:+ start:36 stop:1601 length:1566 start_codon:yes stop_codon:yes gene_type:complete